MYSQINNFSIFIVTVVIIFIVYQFVSIYRFGNFNEKRRTAIVALTRGYKDINKYSMLIDRNKGISKNLIDKSTHIVMLYEDNITNEQQEYIRQQTPDLNNIIFINVKDGNAFKLEKESIRCECPDRLWCDRIKYRHMCSFWFVDFWNYVKDYDMIIRIDEDCVVHHSLDDVFKRLSSKSIIYGKWEDDTWDVVVNLRQITNEFLQEHNLNPITKGIGGPYTNILALNLRKLRDNALLQKYIALIDDTGGIYRHRWGDLPLWGESIRGKIIHPFSVSKKRGMKYYHGSHYRLIN